MKNPLITLILTIMSTLCISQETYKRHMTIMSCIFDITVIAKDQKSADKYIDFAITEMKRIESLISSWDPNSQTSEINRNAGIKPVKVDKELFELISRAISISKVTDGAFDISYGSMDNIWKFNGSMKSLPSDQLMAQSVAKVGYQKIVLDSQQYTVFLKEKGMKIGFGGIGKGYAADKAKELLKSKGVVGGIINASGDMNTWGKQVNGADWNIAITNPLNSNESFGLVPLKKGAVVTSGNYEKYIIIDGQRYSHIIDPRTGIPSKGILSVTVFASSAELADALATAIFVMGIDVGLDRINQLAGLDCIIVDDQGGLHFSNKIQIQQQ